MQATCSAAAALRLLVLAAVLWPFSNLARAETSPAELRKRAKEFFEPLPDRMPGAEKDTLALVKLGKKLFFDAGLSANGSTSCNTCHKLNAANDPYPDQSFRGASGKPLVRNSPTVLNAGFHFAQFWDGRAADLEAQAEMPMLNPDEMGMPSQSELVARVGSNSAYRAKFSAAFPESAAPISIENMARAIAAYERTLITRDRFDDFLKGEDGALSRAERRGLETFLDVGCQECHFGAALGGRSFQKMGRAHPYSNADDPGRWLVTKEESARFKFKTPSLRNVALTAPYFHDGKAQSLASAIRQMAWLQLDKQLPQAEVDSIETFLRALSDKKLVLKRPTKSPADTESYPLVKAVASEVAARRKQNRE